MKKPYMCKNCGKTIQKRKPFQRACSPGCAIELVRLERDKAEQKKRRSQARTARERIKTRGQWLREAQAAFNRYIRCRDAEMPCISCGRHHQGQYHAGHYRAVGSAPELRFDEDNVHKQCAPCNNHKSGNLVEYRKNLLVKIGEQALQSIEGPHEAKRYTISEIKAIKKKYNKLAREAERGGR